MLRGLVTQPELRAVNGQARHDGTVGSLYTEDFDGTERSLVEFDRAGAVPNRQHRRDRTRDGRSRAGVCAHRTVQPPTRPSRPDFIPLAPGPHPRRELTLMRRRRLCLAAVAAWPQAPP